MINLNKFLFSTLMLSSCALYAQSYSVHTTSSNFLGSAINSSGIVGGSNRVTYVERPSPVAFAAIDYPMGRYNRTLITPSSLTTAPTTSTTVADINDSGFAVGAISSVTGFVGRLEAALFATERQIEIGVLPGMQHSQAHAINNHLWVVGKSWDRYDVDARPFVWIPNTIGDMTRGDMYLLPCDRDTNDDGILDLLRCAEENGKAVTVNDSGLIGGHYGRKPYLWGYAQGYDISGWLPEYVDFGRGPEQRAAANMWCEVVSISNNFAFAVQCMNERGALRDYASFISTPTVPSLTQLPPSTKINAINNSGCAVGSFLPKGATERVAIKYCDGVMTDLNTVAMTPDVLTDATDINIRGQILATQGAGLRVISTVLLTPR